MKKDVYFFIFLLFIGYSSLILINEVETKKQDNVKWEQFLQCSENEGDAGCDSCYFLIYGKHIDMFTGETIE
jgi:hypothetical protein